MCVCVCVRERETEREREREKERERKGEREPEKEREVRTEVGARTSVLFSKASHSVMFSKVAPANRRVLSGRTNLVGKGYFRLQFRLSRKDGARLQCV
jgi:hypothetical protein